MARLTKPQTAAIRAFAIETIRSRTPKNGPPHCDTVIEEIRSAIRNVTDKQCRDAIYKTQGIVCKDGFLTCTRQAKPSPTSRA